MTDHRLHALSVCGTDEDGDPYRHEITRQESGRQLIMCAEHDGPATFAHPRYSGVSLVETCRDVPLCLSDACRVRHLIRHDRALLDHEARAASAARKRVA